MFKSFSATLWIVALLLNISSNDGHHDDLEGSYVVSTFVRLASRHSCSGKLENDVSKVPIDSIRILHDIKEELQNLGIEDVRLTDGMALVATIPASPGRESAPVRTRRSCFDWSQYCMDFSFKDFAFSSFLLTFCACLLNLKAE